MAAPVAKSRLATVCSLLNAAGAKYVVIGGFAVALHGVVRATKDIDILIEATADNAARVLKALDRLTWGISRELDPADRRRVIVVPDRGRVDRDLFPHFPSLQRAAAAKFYDTYSDAELKIITAFLSRLTTPEP